MTTQCLFIVLFFTGITPIISSISRKYYPISPGRTWNDARTYCQTNYDDLAIINSAANLLRLKKEAQGPLNNLWIGAYLNPNSFIWSYRNESLGGFNKWMTGNPNNGGGKRFCVLLTSSGAWYSASCALQRAFLCYDDSRSGTDRYVYYSTVKTWSDAQSYCRQSHTDLASIRNISEHSNILGKIPGDSWFGLFREPWKWVDQTEMNLPWLTAQPDNYNANETVAYLYNFMAIDIFDKILPFLCHKVVTEHKQLRLKIRSNQDVNDPAVNAAILEMMQQKLKDHGIEPTVTLKWRKQPDGVVFHKLNIH